MRKLQRDGALIHRVGTMGLVPRQLLFYFTAAVTGLLFFHAHVLVAGVALDMRTRWRLGARPFEGEKQRKVSRSVTAPSGRGVQSASGQQAIATVANLSGERERIWVLRQVLSPIERTAGHRSRTPAVPRANVLNA